MTEGLLLEFDMMALIRDLVYFMAGFMTTFVLGYMIYNNDN
tara:strand:- start:75 stop:197 length:123 start_codon:yes stop_codon:yes gene_type:complete